MINFQRPAFPDLTIFCYMRLYCLSSELYIATAPRNTRTGKQNYLKLL